MASCIVADDQQDIIDVFCEMLGMLEIDVLGTAKNGNEAVQMYKKHNPDLVFTDLNMPKYDGFYAIDKIKQMNPDAKIIVVTGDSTAHESKFLESLNITVIHKPFEISAIQQAISDHISSIHNRTQFKIRYRFKDETKPYLCILSYEQYQNFKELPVIEECKIIKKSLYPFKEYANEMRDAINLAIKNDTSHIRRLSENV